MKFECSDNLINALNLPNDFLDNPFKYLKFVGPYDSSYNYLKYDMVEFKNSMYIVKEDHIIDIDPDNENHYVFFYSLKTE